MEYRITPMTTEDWLAVREIYSEGIATGNATFETDLPVWEKWDGAHRKDCRRLREKQKEFWAGRH